MTTMRDDDVLRAGFQAFTDRERRLAREWADAAPGGWQAFFDCDPELGHEQAAIVPPYSPDGAAAFVLYPLRAGGIGTDALPSGRTLRAQQDMRAALTAVCALPGEVWTGIEAIADASAAEQPF